MVKDGIEESLVLKYKASAALGKKSKQKTEISKDVSAFANATGGQLIYGIAEKGRKAVELYQGAVIMTHRDRPRDPSDGAEGLADGPLRLRPTLLAENLGKPSL